MTPPHLTFDAGKTVRVLDGGTVALRVFTLGGAAPVEPTPEGDDFEVVGDGLVGAAEMDCWKILPTICADVLGVTFLGGTAREGVGVWSESSLSAALDVTEDERDAVDALLCGCLIEVVELRLELGFP